MFGISIKTFIFVLFVFASLFEGNFLSFNDQREITLMFVGDIMMARGVEYKIQKYGQGDFKFPFLKIQPFISEADLLFGNLEGPISNKGVRVGSVYSFRMNPEVIEGLKYAGFDILSLANNHMFDYSRIAIEDTLKILKDSGIDYVGAGFNKKEVYTPLIRTIKETKIALLAFTNLGTRNWEAGESQAGIAWLDENNLIKSIKEAKQKADIIIISFHIGEEYKTEADERQKYWAHLAIDNGADLVIGHHPHVIQEIEKYKNKYIAYSLGNFVFDQDFSKEVREGLILKVIIRNKKIFKVEPIKIKINNYFQPELF
jgi:poly-gamma-glutamate synthesis protein (capsule biosynthesis protein)